jgi:hypothetical protein
MSGRLRWYGIDLSEAPLRRLSEAMLKLEYTKRRSAGFRMADVRRDYLSGRFVERVEWEDVLEDPAGGEIKVQRVELRQVTFRLSGEGPELELQDAPRTLRSFMSALEECAGVELALTEVTAPPMAWLEELEKLTGPVVVIGLTAGGVTLSAHSSAAVSIVGTEDVRQYLAQLTGRKRAEIERLTLQLPAPYDAKCELLSSGRAVLGANVGRAVELLRKTVRAASNSSA